MTTLTLWIGGILTAAGIIVYAATGAASLTALIPVSSMRCRIRSRSLSIVIGSTAPQDRNRSR